MDFISDWFATQEPRVLPSGFAILGTSESDSFHREVLAWSATVWGRYAYLREVVPLIRRGRAYFGSLQGYPARESPVLWVHETWSVTAAIDLGWEELVECLTEWNDGLAHLFPVHFFEPDLADTEFHSGW
jgi:hypothetical protein